jgi:para-nitrobenzyl esterase
MASPLSKDLIAGAIGSSGAAIASPLAPVTLSEKERMGAEFAAKLGAGSLAALRTMPAEQLLQAARGLDVSAYGPAVDGYLLPKFLDETFAAGEQARVPLLVGWNSEETNYRGVLGEAEPTPENYAKAVRALYGEFGGEVLRLYPASTADEVIQAATDLASDRFLGYSTWKWSDLHGATGHGPVYRYFYSHPRPPMVPEMGNAVAGLAGGIVRDPALNAAPAPRGAVHSADIEYAMGNLATNFVYAWTAEDYAVSEVMHACYANFVKAGDPNGEGVPTWPAANGGGEVQVMRWDVQSKVEPEYNRETYLFHDRFLAARGAVRVPR